jgi:pyridoxamine 5'-phosphate oxidase
MTPPLRGTIRRVPTPLPALSEALLENDPITQFSRWFERASALVKPLPHAVALATATRSGHPSVRMVLLKSFDAHGFVFYTNYRSRKGRELARNARASLLFYWGELDQQVRVDGRVVKVMAHESDEYFATRPRGSQLSAWASAQSEVVPNRAALERRFAACARKHAAAVPRPPPWGGYRLAPDAVEFWQGRDDRLHDRILYRRLRPGRWVIERLAP